MANTVTQTTLFTGTQVVKRQINIVSDGTEESDLVIFDRSTFDTETTKGRLMEVQISGSACTLTFEWDQTTDGLITSVNPGDNTKICYFEEGGRPNPGATGATGDILLTTAALDSGDVVNIIFTVHLN